MLSDFLNICVNELSAKLFRSDVVLPVSGFSYQNINYSLDLADQSPVPLPGLLQNWPENVNRPSQASVLPRAVRFGVFHQGSRGTCVASAHGVALETMFDTPEPFSREFLEYWIRKQQSGIHEGSSCYLALRALNEHGCCLESQMPYNRLPTPPSAVLGTDLMLNAPNEQQRQ